METTTIRQTDGRRVTFTYNPSDLPARVAQSRVLTIAFRRGFDAAVWAVGHGSPQRCPYSKPYAAEIWDLGYRYALKGKRDEC